MSMPGSTEGDKWGQMRNAIRAGGSARRRARGTKTMGVEWRLGEVGDLRRVAPSPPGTQDCSLLLLPLVPLGSDKLVEVSRPCQPRCGGPESS